MSNLRDEIADTILRVHEPAFYENVRSSRLRQTLLQQFVEVADALLPIVERERANAAREALEAAADSMVEMGEIWGGGARWLTTGTHVAMLAGDVLRARAQDGA